jgi:hypothetical protein
MEKIDKQQQQQQQQEKDKSSDVTVVAADDLISIGPSVPIKRQKTTFADNDTVTWLFISHCSSLSKIGVEYNGVTLFADGAVDLIKGKSVKVKALRNTDILALIICSKALEYYEDDFQYQNLIKYNRPFDVVTIQKAKVTEKEDKKDVLKIGAVNIKYGWNLAVVSMMPDGISVEVSFDIV